jgi:peptidoglycan/LPS O-acetylase OafA/YrhL
MKQGQRMPGLDGLRAISILLVLLGHVQGTPGFDVIGFLTEWGDLGRLGVQVFFVISGFLITSLLVAEKQATGTISLGRFYVRRALRILPAFLAFLLALAWAQWRGWIQLSGLDWLTALTYTVNYHLARSWFIGHLWSLSVEEQFYLLWPAAMVFFVARRQLVALLAAAILVAPWARFAMRLAFPYNDWNDLEVFPAVADAIAAGCLVALLRERLLQHRLYLAVTHSPWIWGLVLPVLFVTRYIGFTAVDALGSPCAMLMLAVLVETATRRTSGAAAGVLNFKPLAALGILSYSLYLWQQPFLYRQCHSWACTFPTNLGLTFCLAMASYWLLERPMVRWRQRFAASPAAR